MPSTSSPSACLRDKYSVNQTSRSEAPCCRHAGNLLVLQDQEGRPNGRVGFIDFGIVGRVTPVTWKALDALLTATATRDFETMARALATVGATDTDVDVKVRIDHSMYSHPR